MSKNFRSSFIDLLCCRYSKRRLLMINNNSSRTRRVVDNCKNVNSLGRPNDIKTPPSIGLHFPPLNITTGTSNTGGDTGYSSSSHLTAELASKYDQKETENEENNKVSIDPTSSCHITVGTQTNSLDKPHRRRKHMERSPAVLYCSLPTKSTSQASEVLCT